MGSGGAEGATRALSLEAAQARRASWSRRGGGTGGVDLDARESRILARERVGYTVHAEAEDFSKHIAGLSQVPRRMSERMVQMQIVIDKGNSTEQADMVEVRAGGGALGERPSSAQGAAGAVASSGQSAASANRRGAAGDEEVLFEFDRPVAHSRRWPFALPDPRSLACVATFSLRSTVPWMLTLVRRSPVLPSQLFESAAQWHRSVSKKLPSSIERRGHALHVKQGVLASERTSG